MYKGGMTSNSNPRILVVRLGAMGDIIHALPAVASLKNSFPGCDLTWAVEPQWECLLEGNPFVDRVISIEPGNPKLWASGRRELRAGHFDFAVDFQGLIKSAVAASLARPDRLFGLHRSEVREKAAALFYSNEVRTHAAHVVDRNLELAAAAGATTILKSFHIPEGAAESALPEGHFVLASPLAGWRAKQWPLDFYADLGRRLFAEMGIPLVVNAPLGSSLDVPSARPQTWLHTSSVAGLIHATRRAAAVLGVDSGPLHLAAALNKPGVAIFGPTDPQRNGPYGETFTVLRTPNAETTYKRANAIHASMRTIDPDAVFCALKTRLTPSRTAQCQAG